MKCSEELIQYMHDYLDEEITEENEEVLLKHLPDCESCKELFHELQEPIKILSNASFIQAPANFTSNVMAKLPKEKKKTGMKRWVRHHPLITAAALFVVLMTGSLFSSYNDDQEFAVSKQENLIVKNDTVIVPKGEVVKGDIVVRNGTVKIEGEVQGDVTVIHGDKYLASAGRVTGEIEEINEVFDWIWYRMKHTAKNVMNVFDEEKNN